MSADDEALLLSRYVRQRCEHAEPAPPLPTDLAPSPPPLLTSGSPLLQDDAVHELALLTWLNGVVAAVDAEKVVTTFGELKDGATLFLATSILSGLVGPTGRPC